MAHPGRVVLGLVPARPALLHPRSPTNEEERAAWITPVPRAPPGAVEDYAPMPTASAETSAPGADGSSASATRCESDESTFAQYWSTR